MRIPSGWDRKQMLYLDGIRYSIQIADLAYSRLCESLLRLHKRRKGLEEGELTVTITGAMLDAWSIIDSIVRLRGLLGQTPNLKQNVPQLQLFKRKTETVPKLRNRVQHLNHEIEQLVAKEIPALGVISWLVVLNEPEKYLCSCSISAGTFFSRTVPFIMPVGIPLETPIDHVTLNAEVSVNFCDIMAEVENVTRYLEILLRDQFGDLPIAGGTPFLQVEIGQ